MGQPSPKIAYTKPWQSYADQIKLLAQRGLVVTDIQAAEQFLSHLNYYRFSGYCLAFEVKRHEFIPGTTFEQIVQAYEFDLTLRDLVTEALEVVEVDIRATVAYVFGQRHEAFGHVGPASFFSHFNHRDWLERLRDEVQRSSELFVKHFAQTYTEFPDLPVWIATEVMSFGSLSKMVHGMLKRDQKEIAMRYRMQPHILQSWMHHLVYVRNLCAHHSRLWDRVWSIKPELPAGRDWQPPALLSNNRLFSTLLLLRHWMKCLPAIRDFVSRWQVRVAPLDLKRPCQHGSVRQLGPTPNLDLTAGLL
jgi:abortive infection bacteriophage resistance protein